MKAFVITTFSINGWLQTKINKHLKKFYLFIQKAVKKTECIYYFEMKVL